MTNQPPLTSTEGLTQRLDIDFALHAAGLGVWELDTVTKQVRWDDRCRELFGLDKNSLLPYEQAIQTIHPDDLAQVNKAIENAMSPAHDSAYEVTFRTIGVSDGRLRWVRSWGRSYFTDAGELSRFGGVSQDVTQQMQDHQHLEQAQQALAVSETGYRTLSIKLEEQVQQRTQELLVANQELNASYSQVTQTNDQLAESNQLLSRSNDNLQQFAYVASHDLQEPLRKIQAFGDLLRARHATSLGEDIDLLERMQAAAARMTTLIRDLLTYSRIVATTRDAGKPVDLNEVFRTVLTDLELAISEANAQLRLAPLPTIPGDPIQLGQLFQNLLSNALKFRRPEVALLIEVRSQRLPADELPPEVRPAQAAAFYYRLEVADNGIGFDPRYTERIFQVFQRLHSKSQYVGTGIGLAICEKVVTNHGGAITVSSKPGQGATFSVYLPADSGSFS